MKLFISGAENLNWDLQTNGERRVLECLKSISPTCIFDVGANKGEWSLMVRRTYPDCTVHSFEIVPSTFVLLLENTSKDTKIVSNCVGLADRPGKIVIYCSSCNSTVATANKIAGMSFHEAYYDQKVECDLITGKEYIESKDIRRIDFLKIDVEGMDLKVLKGFGEYVQAIKVIQFEYGVFNISSRDLLIDFFTFLGAHNFSIGKVFPNYVDFFEYHFSREDFAGNNYIAVQKRETELISRLSRSHA